MMTRDRRKAAWLAVLAAGMLGAVAAQAQTPAAQETAQASRAAPAGRIANPLHAYTAFGTGESAPWRAVVDGGALKLEGRDLAAQTVQVKGVAQNEGALFTGKVGTKVVRFYVQTKSCLDDNGEDTGYAAVLTIGKQVLRGCAVAGAQAHAPT